MIYPLIIWLYAFLTLVKRGTYLGERLYYGFVVINLNAIWLAEIFENVKISLCGLSISVHLEFSRIDLVFISSPQLWFLVP